MAKNSVVNVGYINNFYMILAVALHPKLLIHGYFDFVFSYESRSIVQTVFLSLSSLILFHVRLLLLHAPGI